MGKLKVIKKLTEFKLDPNKVTKYHIAIVTCVLLLVSFMINIDHNPDIYFMMNHGRYILNNGFTSIEPFTVHEGLAFSFEKWLSCIIFYKLHEWFGMAGIDILSYICTTIMFFVLYKLLNYIGKNEKVSLIFICIAGPIYCFLFLSKRPSMFSNLIFILEIFCLEKFVRERNWKYLCWLPVLSCILMNLHSTIFPVFFILALPYFALNTKLFCIGKPRYPVKNKYDFTMACQLILGLGFSAMALLLNPFHVNSIYYTINSLAVDIWSVEITELAPLSIKSTQLLYILPLILLHLFYLFYNKKLTPIRYLLLFYLTLGMGFSAIRNLQFFLLCSLPLLVFEYSNAKFSEKLRSFGLESFFIFAIATLFIFCLLSSANTFGKENFNNIPTGDMPEGSKVYCDFNTGSYLEWKGYKTYMDGRVELFFEPINGKEDIIMEYVRSRHGIVSLDALQYRYDFDYYLVPKLSALNTAIIERTDWNLIDSTDKYDLWEVIR